MTTILSWNIQNGLGVDGKRSIERIASVIKSHGPPDVLCLQEVSRFVLLDPGNEAPDQVTELADLLPQYTPIFGPAYDIAAPDGRGRQQYGNLILSRLPILSVVNHPLPQPPDPGKRQMPRQAIEATVLCHDGPLRIMTTHLEFHSTAQRRAQILALKEIHAAVSSLANTPGNNAAFGPYQAVDRAATAIVCGDFNCLPRSEEYDLLTNGQPQAADSLVDVSAALYPGEPHEPSCGIYDDRQWVEGPHCRDFFFVSTVLSTVLESLHTDTLSDASDHQPITLSLRNRPSV